MNRMSESWSTARRTPTFSPWWTQSYRGTVPGHSVSSQLFMDDGISGFHILTMIGRQLRLIALAIDLRARRVPHSEFSKHLGTVISLRAWTRSWLPKPRPPPYHAVTQAYENVLNTDLQLKSTDMPEGIALEMLVGDLSTSLHPKK